MGIYVVDSNFFIEAHRNTYPLDVVIGFWEKVKLLAHTGKIISIDKVKNEIFGHNDALEHWCTENLPEDFFRDSSNSMLAYSDVIQWAISESNHYTPKALNEFLGADEADAFLVAYALADKENRILVTQEISNPNQKNRIKIPEPCATLGIRYVNTIEMFRELRERF